MNDASSLLDLAVSDSGFVFDPRSGTTFTVNKTGVVLLRGIVRGLDRGRLMDELETQFEVLEADLHRDIDEFVQLLRENGLVNQDFVVPEATHRADGTLRLTESRPADTGERSELAS